MVWSISSCQKVPERYRTVLILAVGVRSRKTDGHLMALNVASRVHQKNDKLKICGDGGGGGVDVKLSVVCGRKELAKRRTRKMFL